MSTRLPVLEHVALLALGLLVLLRLCGRGLGLLLAPNGYDNDHHDDYHDEQ